MDQPKAKGKEGIREESEDFEEFIPGNLVNKDSSRSADESVMKIIEENHSETNNIANRVLINQNPNETVEEWSTHTRNKQQERNIHFKQFSTLETTAAGNDGPSYSFVIFKSYLPPKHNQTLMDVPRLDPQDSGTVSVYLDKVQGKMQKLVRYKGYTYLDNDKKTFLYMCSKSVRCCGALKANANKTVVYEVGTHNCDTNSTISTTKSECRGGVPNTLHESSKYEESYPKESGPEVKISYLTDNLKVLAYQGTDTSIQIQVHESDTNINEPDVKEEFDSDEVTVEIHSFDDHQIKAEIDNETVKLEVYCDDIGQTTPEQDYSPAFNIKSEDSLVIDNEGAESLLTSNVPPSLNREQEGRSVLKIDSNKSCDTNDHIQNYVSVGANLLGQPAAFKLSTDAQKYISDTSQVESRTVKLKYSLEREITYDMAKQVLELDSDDLNTAAIFRDKNGRKVIYYRGHTYLDDGKPLSMCSNYPCSAALKLEYCLSSDAVTELGLHNCITSDFCDDRVENVKSETQIRTNKKPNLTPGRVSSNGKRKSRGELFIFQQMVKRLKLYNSSEARKFKPVVIINRLLNSFVKVPLEEQTDYTRVYTKNVASSTHINFRGYKHKRISPCSSSSDIISYICVKSNGSCDGSLLMVKNKVIKYRDHFCKGKGRKNCLHLKPDDRKNIIIAHNVKYASTELFYKGYTYLNTHWDKWKIPNGSCWVCSKANCDIYLKIEDNMVSEIGNHVCISDIDGKEDDVMIKTCNVSARRKDNAADSPTKNVLPRFVDPSLIPVVDKKGNSFVIYNGHIYAQLEYEAKSESTLFCIKKQSSDCSGVLQISCGNVSAVSKHSCFQGETLSNEMQKNQDNLALTDPKAIDNVTHDIFNQNKSWRYVLEDGNKLFFYSPPMGRSKGVTYLMYKGYIYRFVPTCSERFQRWDCIYGSPYSTCCGVLSSKNNKPVAVSNHTCREDSVGEKCNENGDGEITIKEENYIQGDSDSIEQMEMETDGNRRPSVNTTVKTIDEDGYFRSDTADNLVNKNIEIKDEEFQDNLVNEDFYDTMIEEGANPSIMPSGKLGCDNKNNFLNTSYNVEMLSFDAEVRENIEHHIQLFDPVETSTDWITMKGGTTVAKGKTKSDIKNEITLPKRL